MMMMMVIGICGALVVFFLSLSLNIPAGRSNKIVYSNLAIYVDRKDVGTPDICNLFFLSLFHRIFEWKICWIRLYPIHLSICPSFLDYI